MLNGSGSGGGVSRISTDTMPTLSVVIPSGVAGVSEIACTTSMPSDTRPKTVYFAGQRRLIRHAHEELRPAAVRLTRLQNRRHRPARRRLAANLRLQHPEPASAVKLRLGRILRQRIPALDDPQPDHAVKGRPVVGAVARQLHEVPDMIRREIGAQVDHELPFRRRDHRLLVGHLGGGERVLEGRRGFGGLGEENGHQKEV